MAFFDKLKKALVGEAPPKREEPTSKPAAEQAAAAAASATPANAPKPGEGFKAVKVTRGIKGWGGPLVVAPTADKHIIYSVTGGGIHPVAQKIADLTGGEPFDGFKSKRDFHEIAVAVIDCGGTARVGVYPMKGVLTIDVHGASPSGPLMKFITEDIFVSGVGVDNITLPEH